MPLQAGQYGAETPSRAWLCEEAEASSPAAAGNCFELAIPMCYETNSGARVPHIPHGMQTTRSLCKASSTYGWVGGPVENQIESKLSTLVIVACGDHLPT